ncbi:MAG: hypothetical protein HC856_05710, partial [Pseudanabaena sp. RU_4_16]|nr:hypothetical protein [Pseudanabaena sp. RU_4_16]
MTSPKKSAAKITKPLGLVVFLLNVAFYQLSGNLGHLLGDSIWIAHQTA